MSLSPWATNIGQFIRDAFCFTGQKGLLLLFIHLGSHSLAIDNHLDVIEHVSEADMKFSGTVQSQDRTQRTLQD